MKRVGFDFETALIEPGLAAPPPVCLTWYELGSDVGGIAHAQLERDECLERLTGWLRDDSVILVGARLPFDVSVSMQEWWDEGLPELWFEKYDKGLVRDVQVTQQLADNAEGRLRGFMNDGTGKARKINYSLADLVLRHLGRNRFAQKDGPNVWRLRYWELSGVPLKDWPEAAVDYAIEDAVDAAVVDEVQENLYWDVAYGNAVAQCQADLALYLGSAWGLRTDPETIDALEAGARARFDELTALLVREGLVRSNGTKDTKAAKARILAVWAELGMEPPLTAKGIEKLAEIDEDFASPDALAELKEEYASLDAAACADCGDDVLEAYAERTSLVTLLDTHVPDLRRGAEVCIQPKYNVLVKSGRTSCSKGRTKKGQAPSAFGYQVQNPRRKSFELPDGRYVGVRECFVARDG